MTRFRWFCTIRLGRLKNCLCYDPFRLYQSIPAATVKRLFDLFGGSVRDTLTRTAQLESLYPGDCATIESERKQDLDDAVQRCDPVLMVEYIGEGTALSNKLDKVTHTLFSLVPFEDYKRFAFLFCSDYVRNAVVEQSEPAATGMQTCLSSSVAVVTLINYDWLSHWFFSSRPGSSPC